MAIERSSFTFQPQGPLQPKAAARWWYWLPLVLVAGVIAAAVLLGRTPSRQDTFFGTEISATPPAGETQVVNRSLGNGLSIRVFDNAPAGPTSQPRVGYELIEDGATEGVKRGPLPLGTTPHLTVPGLALMRGDPDGDGTGWRWTTTYEVTNPSIVAVRAVFAGQLVDAMGPVKLDGIRFVILTADENASRVQVEGLSRAGQVLASAPIADPTFGKSIP
jgi:hypothetical protein